MRCQWVIWLVVAGFAYVSANECDVKGPTECYEDLVTYDTLVFPLYGNDEAKLDDTCGHINMSLFCIQSYAETCQESEECDEKCKNLISEIRDFLKDTGLIEFANNLCQENSPLRQMYLENTECLENHARLYAACHNDSQASQHYMHRTPEANTIESRCCYLSWYKDCFTNVTRDNCGENATITVSFGIHTLLGNMAQELCAFVNVHCDRPPLPSEGTEEDHDMDRDKQPDDHDTDKDKQPDDHDIGKDKPDQTDNDVDNSIDKNTATIQSYSAVIMVLPHIFIMLYLL